MYVGLALAPRTAYNLKRKLAANPTPRDVPGLAALANEVTYEGSASHKRNPGDFGLAPPFGPRTHKTLCDDAGIANKSVAEALLREGVRRGMVSAQVRGKWPQNVWAVTEVGVALEAVLGNPERGHYHGYPMPANDPFRETILARWNGL